MWKNLNSNVVNHQTPLRRFVSKYASTKDRPLKKKMQVMNQDVSKFPIYEYQRSKPTDRRVYVWGQAVTGACGFNKTLHDQKLAKIVRSPSRLPFAEQFDVIDIAAGYGFTLFACKPEKDMTLFGCGLNTDSQLGFQKHGGKTNKPMEIMYYPAPIALPRGRADESLNIKKLAAGRAHSIVLSESDVLFSLGNNAYGQCGRPVVDGEEYAASEMIHRVEGRSIFGEDDKVKEIVCGLDHSLILTENGKVFSCGWGADGQTGLGHFNSIGEWTQVRGDIENEKIVKLACKFDCVFALNDKNEVFGWGNSEYNQLGLSNGIQQVNTPINLKLLKKCGKIIDIATAGSACMVLNDEGDVFVWGFGLVGLGPKADQVIEPTKIPSILFGRNDFSPDSKVCSIFAGFSHFGAVTSTHDLYMWGHNRCACLGLRNEKDQYFPLKASLPAQVLKIECGVDHTVAYCKAFV
ncbi:RCC1-like G exchanging factor-like protein [Contarinia nasturtii]|uniref:RCC1-like G exchanging factor-like protein n=1 Tax=Contarinia nasturtii TaxID=265458 RepID=UPI0012D3C865|nr:RCC1-like G exchanging factor-like protein [Contarinia nasturtii]